MTVTSHCAEQYDVERTTKLINAVTHGGTGSSNEFCCLTHDKESVRKETNVGQVRSSDCHLSFCGHRGFFD